MDVYLVLGLKNERKQCVYKKRFFEKFLPPQLRASQYADVKKKSLTYLPEMFV